MADENQTQKTNYIQRVIGIILCLLPLLIALIALAFGTKGKLPTIFGLVFLVLGLLVVVNNFYCSFIRWPLYYLIHRSKEGYRNVSGLPLFGEILITIGVVYDFGSIYSAALGIIAAFLNTGGSLWFLIATWRDKSLWDR
jgi:hypothetical protein